MFYYFLKDNSPPETTNKSANEIVLGASKSFDNSLDVDESVLNDNDEDAFEVSEVTFRSGYKRLARPATAMPTVNRPQSASRPETGRVNLPISTPNFQGQILKNFFCFSLTAPYLNYGKILMRYSRHLFCFVLILHIR